MKYKLFIFILLLQVTCCTSDKKDSVTTPDPIDTAKKPDTIPVNKDTAAPGELIRTIIFQVKTNNHKDFPDGWMPWIDLENSEKEMKLLGYPDSLVISEPNITLIIDYPLNNPYKEDLNSQTGFTRIQLLKEICLAYRKIYKEEEETATIKTIPLNKRGNTINRNETNGKYGIWGHDLSDLALDDILEYKTKTGQIILMLDMDS